MPDIIDLMKALKDSIEQMCACGHKYGEHRGPIPKCARRDCDCTAFKPAEEDNTTGEET